MLTLRHGSISDLIASKIRRERAHFKRRSIREEPVKYTSLFSLLLAVTACALFATRVQAQSNQDPDFSNVNDIRHGDRTLLKDDGHRDLWCLDGGQRFCYLCKLGLGLKLFPQPAQYLDQQLWCVRCEGSRNKILLRLDVQSAERNRSRDSFTCRPFSWRRLLHGSVGRRAACTVSSAANASHFLNGDYRRSDG